MSPNTTFILSLAILGISITPDILRRMGQLEDGEGEIAPRLVCAMLSIVGILFSDDPVLKVSFAIFLVSHITPLFFKLVLFIYFLVARRKIFKKFWNLSFNSLNDDEKKSFLDFSKNVSFSLDTENNVIHGIYNKDQFSLTDANRFVVIVINHLFAYEENKSTQVPNEVFSTSLYQLLIQNFNETEKSDSNLTIQWDESGN